SEQNLIRLYRHLLKDYESDVRPSIRHDLPINVTFSFSADAHYKESVMSTDVLVNFQGNVSWSVAGIFKSSCPLDVRYYPADAHYKESVMSTDVLVNFQGNVSWSVAGIFKSSCPLDVRYYPADAHYKESVMSTDVLVNFQGNVSWSVAGIFKSSCPLDVRYYPFDFQNCVLKFASWAYDGTKIDILLNSEKGDETNFMTSTEWHLSLIRAEKNYIIYSCCPEPYPFVDVHISIQRRPMFYVFNLILPCVLISAIALLGFYMPSDSGEKVTLGITSLLSTTVFLMLVAEGMPPTSEALPLIGEKFFHFFLCYQNSLLLFFNYNILYKRISMEFFILKF
uniref:Neurotransmitter-gated ion-channel ligand-binding domain-containing protein n=1 Tax=Ascaris lumbricoides TaxID=6252 RepID=A0A9J2Q9U4_ASCLU